MPRPVRYSAAARASFLVVLACACSDPSTGPAPAPALEPVPFEKLPSGKLVFQRGLDTYVIDASARSSTSIRSDRLLVHPAVSPDGRRIAFAGFTNSTTAHDIYVSSVDGSGLQQVSAHSGQDRTPGWTPNGQRLVYYVDSVDGATVYTQSPVSNPTDRVEVKVLSSRFQISGRQNPISVSADGVYVFADTRDTDERATIYRFEADDAEPIPLFALPRGDERLRFHSPTWAPDGQRIAFLEVAFGSGWNIAATRLRVVNRDGTGVTTLATVPDGGPVWIPVLGPATFSLCWSPDVTRIVFSAPVGSMRSRIFVVDTRTGELTPVTSPPGNPGDGSVSCSRS